MLLDRTAVMQTQWSAAACNICHSFSMRAPYCSHILEHVHPSAVARRVTRSRFGPPPQPRPKDPRFPRRTKSSISGTIFLVIAGSSWVLAGFLLDSSRQYYGVTPTRPDSISLQRKPGRFFFSVLFRIWELRPQLGGPHVRWKNLLFFPCPGGMIALKAKMGRAVRFSLMPDEVQDTFQIYTHPEAAHGETPNVEQPGFGQSRHATIGLGPAPVSVTAQAHYASLHNAALFFCRLIPPSQIWAQGSHQRLSLASKLRYRVWLPLLSPTTPLGLLGERLTNERQ